MVSGFNSIGNWDLSVNPYGSGDLGSPGAPNLSSSGTNDLFTLEEFEIFPNPCMGKLNIHSTFYKRVISDISIVNLVGQEKYLIRNYFGDKIKIDLDTDRLEKGVWLIKLRYDNNIDVRKVIVF